MALEIGAGITLGGGITLTVESGGGGGGYAPQYTSNPGGSYYPTTADYAMVTYHDSWGLTVSRMKNTSALYTFFTTAGFGDTFKVTFSGTVYTFTMGDYNPGTVFEESVNGSSYWTTADMGAGIASPSPSLSAGEGVTLYGTLMSDLNNT